MADSRSWRRFIKGRYDAIIQQDDIPPLHRAVVDGNTMSLLSLLATQVDINQEYELSMYGLSYTTLHLAVHLEKLEIVKILLENGANVHKRDFSGCTPLHHANNQEVAKLLLYKGSDIMARDEYQKTPLHWTNNQDMAKLLLDNGADIMARDKYQKTPLHYANNQEMAKLHLDKEADIMARDKNQCTPLHYASNQEMAKLLLDKEADIMARDKDHQTPMQFSVKREHFESASVMLTHAASPTTQTWVEKSVATAQVTENQEVKESILSICADMLSEPASNYQDDNILEWSNCDLTDSNLQDKLQHLPEKGRYLALFLNKNKITTLTNLKAYEQLKSLKYLNVSGNPVHTVQGLPINLKELYIYNTEVEVLSKDCFHEKTFTAVKTALVHARLYNDLKQPPKEVFDRGLDNVLNYFSRGHLLSNCRYRMVTVGDTGAGKTSLILAIISGKPYLTRETDRTRVMDLREWHINESDTFNLLDQGGHTVYDITNDYFIARGCIILIVHDLSNPKTIARTIDIVRNTLHHHPENKTIVALSHIDEIDNVAQLSNEFQREIENLLKGEIATFKRLLENPANKGFIDENHVKNMVDSYQNKLSDIEFFLVSSKSYSGVEELKSFLIQKISRQRVHIPMYWINCFSVMSESDTSFWSLSELCSVLKGRNKRELIPCLRYLSDTGMVVWYEDHPTLQQFVFQNTEFLVSVMKSLFHHNLRSTLKYEEDSELQHRFTESELEDVLRKYEQEGILKHTFLQYLWKKYNLNPEHEKALIDLIKKFHIFSEIFTEQDEVHRTLYFVPWFVKGNKPPQNVNIDSPLVITSNLASLNIQCVFHNRIPLNVTEFLLVEIQKFAVEEGYLGTRYAWADGLQVNIDQTTITAFRNKKESSITLVVTADYRKLLDMWHSLGTLNKSLQSVLKSYHGSLRSYHSICLHCYLFGLCPAHRWLPEQVLPERSLKSLFVNCQVDNATVPAALVTRIPEDEKLQNRLETVRIYLQTGGKEPERSIEITSEQVQPDVSILSKQMARLDSNISAKLAHHQDQSSFENQVLSEQLFRHNQQLSVQGKIHAQESHAQNIALSQQMYSQNQQLYHQGQAHAQQNFVQNQALAGQMCSQNQQLYHQGQAHAQQNFVQNQALAGQMYSQNQQLYHQGQTHAQQNFVQNQALAGQMYSQNQQLYHQGQAHAQQNLAQNQALTGQMYSQNQQLYYQGQTHAQQNLSQNQALSGQMYSQNQHLYHQGQAHAQQNLAQNQALAGQMYSQNQRLYYQGQTHTQQNLAQNQALAGQMYSQNQQLYYQGQTHAQQNLAQNQALAGQMYSQNQQLYHQGQAHAQQNLAQNQALTGQMYSQNQQLYYQGQTHTQQNLAQNQALAGQMYSQNQQLYLQGQAHAQQNLKQNQALFQQMYQHHDESSFENLVLSEQMYHHNQQLYLQGQVHAQRSLAQNQMLSQQMHQREAQSSIENLVLSGQMYLQNQQLYQQGQAHAEQSLAQGTQLATQLTDVVRLEAGDATGIQLNLQHRVLIKHRRFLEQNLQVDSELLNNLWSSYFISIEDKSRIESDSNESSRVSRMLKLLERIDNDNDNEVLNFVTSLCMCKKDGTNYVLGEMLQKDMHGS